MSVDAPDTHPQPTLVVSALQTDLHKDNTGNI